MRPSLNCNAFDAHTCKSGSFTIQHTEEYYVCFWDYLTWGFPLLPSLRKHPYHMCQLRAIEALKWSLYCLPVTSATTDERDLQLQSAIWYPTTWARCMLLLPPLLEYSQATWIYLENRETELRERYCDQLLSPACAQKSPNCSNFSTIINT